MLPRLNEDVNEEWLSDKSRYACDGLAPAAGHALCSQCDGMLEAASWDEAFAAIAERLNGVSGTAIAALAGDLCDAESMFALKQLMDGLGVAHLDCRQDGAALDPSVRAGYLFNTTIAGIEQADACLIVGSNPRWEAPILNARIRKRWLRGGLKVGVIGPQVDLTYPAEYLGAGPDTLRADRRRQPSLRRGPAPGRAADADPGPGGAGPQRRRAMLALARRSPTNWGWSRTTGTASTCCTRPPRASAVSISASCPGGRSRYGGHRRRLRRGRHRGAVPSGRGRDRHGRAGRWRS